MDPGIQYELPSGVLIPFATVPLLKGSTWPGRGPPARGSITAAVVHLDWSITMPTQLLNILNLNSVCTVCTKNKAHREMCTDGLLEHWREESPAKILKG